MTVRPLRSPALSPSRASDFRQCPLMFRLRAVDRIPEPPSSAATLGTLVHAVLERLFDAPASERTVETAHALIAPEWARMQEADHALAGLHAAPQEERAWLADAASRVATYFGLENPQRLEPESREELVEFQLPDGPLLRGVIDRVDVAADGSIRVVDYKSGKTPAAQYGQAAKFQMRFYALLVERLRGRAPAVLQLLYLKDGGTVVLRPTATDIDLVEHEIRDLWRDIEDAARRGAFAPRRSALCGWCSFQALCPEFGGTPPTLTPEMASKALGVVSPGNQSAEA